MGKLFGTSGIRGIFGVDIDANFAIRLGYAISTLGVKRVIVGWDCRKSSPILGHSLASGLASCGMDVEIAGLVSTPAFQAYIKYSRSYDLGIMVTASHNPPQYNGFKVFSGEGLEIYPDTEKKIEDALFSNDLVNLLWDRTGHINIVSNEKVCDLYVNQLFRFVDKPLNNYEIVADLAGCSSILTIPKFISKLGIKGHYINDHIDGRFQTRPAEPRPDNILQLCKEVTAKNVWFGVAFDGDGDRAIFVDESGKAWWGDSTGILIGKYLIETGQTKYVVTPITSTIATEKVIENIGGKVIRTKVGGKNIVKKMIELNATWGFEENGGGIYGPHIYGRDGGITLLLIMKILKYYNKPLSKLLSELPQYIQIKEKIHIKNRKIINQILKLLNEKYSKYRVDTTEGIKIFFDDDEWVLVRPSGTEPVIRVFGEAKKFSRVKEIIHTIMKEINNITKISL